MKPYYESDNGVLMHGDCLNVMEEAIDKYGPVDAVICDPVWPNFCDGILPDGWTPYTLFEEAVKIFVPKIKRVVVHLGIDSDPSILKPLAEKMTFFRACWLPYAAPGKKGRILYSGDIAYIYGEPPRSRKGNMLIAGESPAVQWDKNKKTKNHPCPRNPLHVMWLIDKFSNPGETILDPFAGAGTTLFGTEALNVRNGDKAPRRYIGIEMEEKHCATAREEIKVVIQNRPLFKSKPKEKNRKLFPIPRGKVGK